MVGTMVALVDDSTNEKNLLSQTDRALAAHTIR